MKKRPYIDSKKKQNFLAPAPFSLDFSEPVLQQQLQQLAEEQIKAFQQRIQEILSQQPSPGPAPEIPLSVFHADISTLEVVVKYLHEKEQRSFSDIASLLNRDPRTIWHAYQRAVKKRIHLRVTPSSPTIPVSLFCDRESAPLETVTAYLHDIRKLSFSEIAKLLQRSPKTIWTVYQRKQAKKKQQKQNQK